MINRNRNTEVLAVQRVVNCVSYVGCPSLCEVARMLDVSPRSLQRVLSERGTTFSRIAEQSRRQSAFQLLVREDLSVTEVAERLGYSDPSNFGRAFRKWTGQSPAKWRESVQRHDNLRRSTT